MAASDPVPCVHGVLAPSTCLYCVSGGTGLWGIPPVPLAAPTAMGWRCPGCGAVWSPTTTGCLNCTGHREASRGCTCASGYPLICPTHSGMVTGSTSADVVDFIAKGHLGTPCPRPRDGGMCGCDEDEPEGPQDCYRARCDC